MNKNNNEKEKLCFFPLWVIISLLIGGIIALKMDLGVRIGAVFELGIGTIIGLFIYLWVKKSKEKE